MNFFNNFALRIRKVISEKIIMGPSNKNYDICGKSLFKLFLILNYNL